MKSICVVALSCLAMAALGCASFHEAMDPAGNPRATEQRKLENAELVTAPFEDSVIKGVIAEHSLRPYHFVERSASLNELGQTHVQILADHYASNPGQVHLNSDEHSEKLRKQRIETIVSALEEGGVDTARVQIREDLPGGDGMSSREVLLIINAPEGE